MDVITLALAKKYAKNLKSNIINIKPSTDGSSIIFILENGMHFSIPIVTTTPSIGENGNWFINGVDTGKASQGKDGTDYVLTTADKSEIAQIVYESYIANLNKLLETRLNGGETNG